MNNNYILDLLVNKGCQLLSFLFITKRMVKVLLSLMKTTTTTTTSLRPPGRTGKERRHLVRIALTVRIIFDKNKNLCPPLNRLCLIFF